LLNGALYHSLAEKVCELAAEFTKRSNYLPFLILAFACLAQVGASTDFGVRD